MEINSLPVELTVVWNGNFNIDNPAQNKGKELFQLVLGSGNLSNGPRRSLRLTKPPPSPCAVWCCSLHSANYQFFCVLCVSPPHTSLFAPEKYDSPSHLCCFPFSFIIFASHFSPRVCVLFLCPSLSSFVPLFISPAVMLFKLTCQEIGRALLRGNVVINRGRERWRRKAAACQWEKSEQNKMIIAKDRKPPPAQSLALFNYHPWHRIDVSLTEGFCTSSRNPEAGIFAGDGRSIHIIFFLLVHYPQPP